MWILSGIIFLILAIVLFRFSPLLATLALLASCWTGSQASTNDVGVFAGVCGVIALLSLLVLLIFN